MSGGDLGIIVESTDSDGVFYRLGLNMPGTQVRRGSFDQLEYRVVGGEWNDFDFQLEEVFGPIWLNEWSGNFHLKPTRCDQYIEIRDGRPQCSQFSLLNHEGYLEVFNPLPSIPEGSGCSDPGACNFTNKCASPDAEGNGKGN